MSENLGELSKRKGIDRNLFDLLGKAASKTGTPSSAEIQALAEEFLMGTANVYGTASFYDFLKPENEGKKVFVCNGSACLLAGTQDAVKTELGKHFKAEEIGEMCCLGRCHENKCFLEPPEPRSTNRT